MNTSNLVVVSFKAEYLDLCLVLPGSLCKSPWLALPSSGLAEDRAVLSLVGWVAPGLAIARPGILSDTTQ